LITSGAGSNAQAVVDRVLSDERPDRIMTGFSKFDEATGGFARKDLVLIAANTGGGKSIMAEQLAINAYIRTKQYRNVCLVSFEMDIEELYARLISNLTKLSFENIYLRKWTYNKKEDLRDRCRAAWSAFNESGEIEGNKFTIYCPTIDVTPNQIGALLRPAGYDLIIIDYVGLVGTEREAQLWESLGETTRQFKGVARRNDAVVVIMAQMDEETKKVKYSKAMRHHSSYVWKWEYGEDEEESHQILVNQEKTRHCKQFPFALIANFDTMSFADAKDDDEPEDMSSKDEARFVLGDEIDTGAGSQPTAAADLIAKAERRQRESEKEHSALDEAKRLAKRATMDRHDLSMKNADPPVVDEGDL
jgi:KaiC/GvpD/RAD55 family RecA-like ATPase